jgi:KipI family sensor histidine kinase inhibitor
VGEESPRGVDPGEVEPGPAYAGEVVDLGDSALLVVLGREVDPATNVRVHALARRLEAIRPGSPGIGRGVPGHASLLVPYDPLMIPAAEVRGAIAGLLAGTPAAPGGPNGPGAPRGPGGSVAPTKPTGPVERLDLPPLEVPVRYGGLDGPDLDSVAAATGLSTAEVVALHASCTYRVFMIGFSPGFAYLGMLPPELALPRRATPRTSVPAGSVAIAGRQTAVYPAATPGGWHLIGRTGLALWDPARTPPALLEPGRAVRFVPE